MFTRFLCLLVFTCLLVFYDYLRLLMLTYVYYD